MAAQEKSDEFRQRIRRHRPADPPARGDHPTNCETSRSNAGEAPVVERLVFQERAQPQFVVLGALEQIRPSLKASFQSADERQLAFWNRRIPRHIAAGKPRPFFPEDRQQLVLRAGQFLQQLPDLLLPVGTDQFRQSGCGGNGHGGNL
jgi:hypothetical protein